MKMELPEHIKVPEPHSLKTDPITRSVITDMSTSKATLLDSPVEETKPNSHWNPNLEIFIFKYKRGHSVLELNIQAASFREANDLGHEVCKRRRWTFIVVTPFIRDIKRLLDPAYYETT